MLCLSYLFIYFWCTKLINIHLQIQLVHDFFLGGVGALRSHILIFY